MPNVSISSSFINFHDPLNEEEDAGVTDTSSPDYLLQREVAERTAAKRSAAPAARAAHQQLAQMYADRRQRSQRGSA